jgi:hypothetical protein
MGAAGSATLDFGAAPGSSYATVVVTGEAGIGSGSHVEAFVMGESSASHTAYEHIIAPIKLVCSDIVAGTGFTIHGTTQHRLTGAFTVRWVWV